MLRLRDKALTVLIAGSFWYGALTVGAFGEALEASSQALEIADGNTNLGRGFPGVPDHPYAICLFGRGYARAFLGDVPGGSADLEAAIALVGGSEATEVEPSVRSGMSFIAAMLGDGPAALANAEVALASAKLTDISLALSAAYLAHVWAGCSLGDMERVTWAAREMLTVAESRGVGLELRTFAYGGLADAALAAGDVNLALHYAGRALDASLHPSALWGELVAQLRPWPRCWGCATTAATGSPPQPRSRARLDGARADLDPDLRPVAAPGECGPRAARGGRHRGGQARARGRACRHRPQGRYDGRRAPHGRPHSLHLSGADLRRAGLTGWGAGPAADEAAP